MLQNGNIIIVADLGQLKAYRVTAVTGIDRQETMQVSHANRKGTEKRTLNLELLSDIDYIAAHTRASEELSDKSGQFGASSGEPHNLKLEQARRGLKQIAEDIGTLLAKESPKAWHLAFPKETNRQLRELLENGVKASLGTNVASDLTKVRKEKLLSHFTA